MKRTFFAISALLLGSVASNAHAQCPANPLNTLTGNYTFSVEGVLPYVYGITGVMKTSQGVDRAGNPIGILTITASSYYRNSYTRLETDIGRYQINSTCTGGTLTFNLSSRPMQYDFWLFDGGKRIVIISTINGYQATGTASPAPTGCPAGLTNPLELQLGKWTFTGRGIEQYPNYAIAGIYNAALGTDRGGNQIGVLSITATSNLASEGSVTRLEGDTGRFQAWADCSGGTLTFNLSSRPVQFDFWYHDGFQHLNFISTNAVPVLGWANR